MTHLDMVAEFHRAFGHPIRTIPGADVSEKALRMNLIQEEVDELASALGLEWDEDSGTWYDIGASVNTVEVADALADIDYVVQGAALVFGIPHDAVFDEVHRSNMAKLVDGKVIRREDGKVLKPEGWTPPDVLGVLLGSLDR